MVDIKGVTIVAGDKVLVECEYWRDDLTPGAIILKTPPRPNGTANPNIILMGNTVEKGTLPTP